MNTTPLAALLAATDPQTVLYGVAVPGGATLYTLRGGTLYLHRATDGGHGCMVPQYGDRAAWARVAAACAFTAPANPHTMHLGAAGERLGAFWRALPNVAAEGRVALPDLLAVALSA